MRALHTFKRCLKQGSSLQARRFAQDAPQPAVQDIVIPHEGLIVLDGYVYMYTVTVEHCCICLCDHF